MHFCVRSSGLGKIKRCINQKFRRALQKVHARPLSRPRMNTKGPVCHQAASLVCLGISCTSLFLSAVCRRSDGTLVFSSGCPPTPPGALSQVSAVLHVEPVALGEAGAALPVAAALVGDLREGVWSDQVPADGRTTNTAVLLSHSLLY